MSFDKSLWNDPPAQFRVNAIMHDLADLPDVAADAVKAFGYGGVVTNPSWKGEYASAENIKNFKQTLSLLDSKELSYWIYDEKGYPSGYAGGKTLEGHPELEAKGFYMRRIVAYEPRKVTFHLDDESDKIVWAAKYSLDTPGLHESIVKYDTMVPVAFDEKYCETELEANQIFFVFCVKPAYEGSQCTHNTCSFSRYINIMDKNAVRRFIDVFFEPLAAQIPDVFSRADAVFTDEPSLMVGYARPYEVWAWAIAPWVDGLFEYYENEYGESVLPLLPLIFEGGPEGFAVRYRMHRLVGKLIAESYSGQLAAWCEAHGGKFSGHYMGEESIGSHVRRYGSYIDVLNRTSYPGLDVLWCYPEIYSFNTAKYPQMSMRKTGHDGMMVEICPFADIENFKKDPLNNMCGVMGILYMSGVRVTNSYFYPNFAEYSPDKLAEKTGYISKSESRFFNEYVGRMGVMLDGLKNDCGVFVYYGIEDVQAKMMPQNTAFFMGPECDADGVTEPVTNAVMRSGHDFYYADSDDIVSAVKDGFISGHKVEKIIVPAIDVMLEASYNALKELKKSGIEVMFIDRIPKYSLSDEVSVRKDAEFVPVSLENVIERLSADDKFTVTAPGAEILRARFIRDGRELWMIDNNTRNDVEARLLHSEKEDAELWDPSDSCVTEIHSGDTVTLKSFRSVFVWFK